MSCAVMFQPQISADSLRQRFYQQNDSELLNSTICNINDNRSTSPENTKERYKPHISCLANTKLTTQMVQDHPIHNKYINTADSISRYSEKIDKNTVNYVLVKNYAGDVETVVDEHFSRALASSRKIDEVTKGRVTTAKQFPASYYQPIRYSKTLHNHNNSSRYHPYCNLPTSDHWATMSAQEYKSFSHRGMYSESYPPLGATLPYQYALQTFQPPLSKMATNEFHPQTIKPEGWVSRHYESVNNHYYQENGFEPTYISSPHHGTESNIPQEYPKDFYWL